MAPAVMAVWEVTAPMSITSASLLQARATATCGRTQTGNQWVVTDSQRTCRVCILKISCKGYSCWYNLCVLAYIPQMTLQQICADVNRSKSWGQHAQLDSGQRNAPPGRPNIGEVALEILNSVLHSVKCHGFDINLRFLIMHLEFYFVFRVKL